LNDFGKIQARRYLILKGRMLDLIGERESRRLEILVHSCIGAENPVQRVFGPSQGCES